MFLQRLRDNTVCVFVQEIHKQGKRQVVFFVNCGRRKWDRHPRHALQLSGCLFDASALLSTRLPRPPHVNEQTSCFPWKGLLDEIPLLAVIKTRPHILIRPFILFFPSASAESFLPLNPWTVHRDVVEHRNFFLFDLLGRVSNHVSRWSWLRMYR